MIAITTKLPKHGLETPTALPVLHCGGDGDVHQSEVKRASNDSQYSTKLKDKRQAKQAIASMNPPNTTFSVLINLYTVTDFCGLNGKFFLPLTVVARRAKANFVKKTRQTEAVQEQFLYSLLLAYQDTELGRKYRLSEIKTIDQFRAYSGSTLQQL